LLVGYFADVWSRRKLMLVTYVVVAVAIPMLFLVTPQHPGYVYLFAITFGFSMGADYMLIPLMAADLFGLRSLGRAMSAIIPTDTITQYWFPNLIAVLRAAWGGYSSALWVACGMAALGAAAVAGLQGTEHAQPAVSTPAAGSKEQDQPYVLRKNEI
jgi:MFS family permease